MSVTTIEKPSAFGPSILVTVTGATRDEVLAAAIRWRDQHWGYSATITDPELVGEVWIATGTRWATL